MKQSRFVVLHQWLCQQFAVTTIELNALTGDAGFRVYYRFKVNNQSFIAVDALPNHSNNQAFVKVQKHFAAQGLRVPEILFLDLSRGFFCLTDFGDVLFADVVNSTNMIEYYTQAIDLIPKIAKTANVKELSLPYYDDKFIAVELAIFSEWLIEKHLQIALSTTEKEKLSDCFKVLIDNALGQPQVVMHRDYHSRNIMLIKEGDLGIIDFQDAVLGPITYDVVSLLRDCYMRWPQEQVEFLFNYFCRLMTTQYSLANITSSQWQRWFDLMGLQRHLKASGIFARLFHRDQKSAYLKDIPLTLAYVIEISAKFPELNFLHQLVSQRVLPAVTVIKQPLRSSFGGA